MKMRCPRCGCGPVGGTWDLKEYRMKCPNGHDWAASGAPGRQETLF